MSPLEARLNHCANLIVGGTGLVYAWTLYFAESDDEFSLLNHPWQDDVQALHLVTAPLLIFSAATLWKQHIWARMVSGQNKRRRTGLILTSTLFPMIFSGYLLQVAIDPTWRKVWMWVHLIASALWLVGALVHPLAGRFRRHGELLAHSEKVIPARTGRATTARRRRRQNR